MRRGSLRPQRFALVDSEPVLLVDDDEPEVGEGRALAQEGVRADDDERLTRRDAQGCAASFRCRELPGEQRRHDPRSEFGAEHPGDRAKMLSGEDLGRRDEGGLPPALGDLEHRSERHQRLPRADLALHETVHRPGPGEVRADARTDLDLILGELERQSRIEVGQQRARCPGGRRHRPHEVTLLQQRRLQHEGLVHAERLSGWFDLLVEVRTVDAFDGGAQRKQTRSLAKPVGQRVGHGVEHVERVVDELGDLPARQRARRRIDRDRKLRPRFGRHESGVDVIEEFVGGMRQLHRPAVLPHLSREGAATPRPEVLHAPGLIEERQRHLAGAVADHDLEDAPAAVAHAPFADAAHLGHDGDRLSNGQCEDGRQLAPTGVATRIVAEQIAHGPHPERALQRLGRRADDTVEAGVEGGHGRKSRHRHRRPRLCRVER